MVRTATLVLLSLGVACGSRSADDVLSNSAASMGPHPTALQRGTVIDFGSDAPIANATVRVADRTVTSDALGRYALPVDTRAPFPTEVSADGYVPLTDQWAVLEVDAERSATFLFSTTRAKAILGALDGYDAALGVLMIEAIAIGDCRDVSGAQIHASQPAAKIAYFSGGLPRSGLDHVTAGEIPSAIVYDLAPGAAVDVTVDSPSCAAADRPVRLNDVTYYEVVPVAQAGLSFERVFLGLVPPESAPAE